MDSIIQLDDNDEIGHTSLLNFFGPDESTKPQKKKNKKILESSPPSECEGMDSFLNLFDPSKENETSVDRNDLNGNFPRKKKSKKVPKIVTDSMNLNIDKLPEQLPSEPQEGNVEYKLKLINPNNERFKRLVSQMQWRLREGCGEAIYEIGVEDSGYMLGLSESDMTASMYTLRKMANQLGASLTVIREKVITKSIVSHRKVAEILVRKVPDDQYSIEIRIAVVGNSDVGKSTLLAVVTRGELDNGRGCARLNVFRHRHEIYSGKTSSISLQFMGFDSEGHVIDQSCSRGRDYADEDICKKSSKIINFIDLAGDQKYLHTTAFGLSGYSPHYALLVVSAFSGVAPMTEEHLSLAKAFDVPIIIAITKTDIASDAQIENTISDLKRALTQPGYSRVPLIIDTVDCAITAGSNQIDSQTVPIFCVSSVTGHGLALLKKFLFVLPPKLNIKERQKLEQAESEFQIDEVFNVDRNCVVGGLLTQGVITQGSSLLLGPFDDCSFQSVKVASIHRNKVPCRVVYAGQSASLSLKGIRRELRKGMKLLHADLQPNACTFFQATLCVQQQDSLIYTGFQTTVHIGSIRQTVKIVAIWGHESLRTGQHTSVILRFLRHPEYIQVNSRLLFRSGATKGTGRVTQVFGEEPKKSLLSDQER